jgi:hypothetical protein
LKSPDVPWNAASASMSISEKEPLTINTMENKMQKTEPNVNFLPTFAMIAPPYLCI